MYLCAANNMVVYNYNGMKNDGMFGAIDDLGNNILMLLTLLESNYDTKYQVEEVQHPFGCGLLLSAWGPS